MIKKSYKIILTLLIFFSIFFSFSNTSKALSVGDSCVDGALCGTDASGHKLTCKLEKCAIEDTAAPTAKTEPKKTTEINFTPQVPFGDTITSADIKGGAGLAKYINNVYKYAIGVVGILATIIMMWGGVRWITAGGDSSAVGDAKKWIEGALMGLTLTMTSYMILNFVNPDLVNFKLITITPVTSEEVATARTGFKGDTCDRYRSALSGSVIDFNQITGPTPAVSNRCYNAAFDTVANATDTKINVNLLRAISARESQCDKNVARSKSIPPACGIMQMKAGTAKSIDTKLSAYSDEAVCQMLEANTDSVAIKLAAKYLNTHNGPGIKLSETIAGYHGGYGTSGSGPLAPSVNCDGFKKYECCIDPQDLEPTQVYTTDVEKIYKNFVINPTAP